MEEYGITEEQADQFADFAAKVVEGAESVVYGSQLADEMRKELEAEVKGEAFYKSDKETAEKMLGVAVGAMVGSLKEGFDDADEYMEKEFSKILDGLGKKDKKDDKKKDGD